MFKKIMKQLKNLSRGSSSRRHHHYRRGSSSSRRFNHSPMSVSKYYKRRGRSSS